MTVKNKYYLNWAIRLIILVLAFYFIWEKLNDNKNLTSFLAIVKGLNSTSVIIVINLVALLMLLNWLTESFKWRMMVYDVEPISYWTAVQSVFCGLTLGVITPNRVGEYGSRMFFLRPRKRVYGIIAMSVGAFAQFVLTNIVACIAFLVFLHQFKHVTNSYILGLEFIFGIYCAILLLLYFNITLVRQLLRRLKFMKRYMHFFSILSTYKEGFLLKILGICAFRLCILIVQYYLIIHLMIPQITFMQVTLMIVLLFSVQTVAPTIDVLDIGVRGATAVYFFSFITNQDVAILATTALIWLINLIIPAAIGTIFVFRLNIFKQSNS